MPVIILGVTVVAIVAVIGFALLNSSATSGSSVECSQQVTPQQGATVDEPMVMPNMGSRHVATGSPLEYLNCPPTSGNHYSQAGLAPLRPAYYGPDAGVGPGSWIHNLEHGFAVVLYRCKDGTCPDEAEVVELRRFVAEGPSSAGAVRCGYPSKVVVARFDQMATPFAFLAWDRLLLQQSYDRAAALDFASTWIEKTAPEGAC